jgi:hypothetical protein
MSDQSDHDFGDESARPLPCTAELDDIETVIGIDDGRK